MPRLVYTQAMVEFVRDAYQRLSVPDLTDEFNRKFGMKKTPKHIKAMISNHGITTSRKRGDLLRGRLRAFTNEQAEFIRLAYQRTSIANITRELNDKFGLSVKESQVRAFTRNHGYKSGRTGYFEPGSESWNKGMKGWQAGGRSVETQFKPRGANLDYRSFNQAEVGDEVVDSYGYRKRKVEQPNVWQFCHILLWEQHHGKVPDGHIVRFLDNDKTNISIDNLCLVSRGANGVLNKSPVKLEEFETELRKAVVTVAEIRAKASQKLRKRGEK